MPGKPDGRPTTREARGDMSCLSAMNTVYHFHIKPG